MSLVIEAPVLRKQPAGPNTWRVDFYAPELARLAQPGQFIHVRCGATRDPLLRRPFSLHQVQAETGVVSILFRQVGQGTALLSQVQPGALVNLMGPLGQGYTVGQAPGKTVLVAGGIGVAPLLFLARQLVAAGSQVYAYIGARQAAELLCLTELTEMGVTVQTATDDGSRGFHGPVTTLMSRDCHWREAVMVYACGPRPMLQALAGILTAAGVPGEVSLESAMGCGVGACLACACKTKDGDGTKVSRVCADGPVFPVEEVVWQ